MLNSITLPRRWGMHPDAWIKFIHASNEASINLSEHPTLRIVQTIGDAVASAGYHASDGTITVGGIQVPYCASWDISVRWLTQADIKRWLDALAWWGIAGWFRAWTDNFHMHVIYAGAPMKEQLQGQVEDFLNDRNGLAGHGRETFWTADRVQDNYIRSVYRWGNHGASPPSKPPHLKPPPAPGVPAVPGLQYALYLNDRHVLDMPVESKKSWCPVRKWYGLLGIDEDEIRWQPVNNRVYVQDRLLDADIRIMTLNGQRNGYAEIRELVEFSDFEMNVDTRQHKVVVKRK